MEYIFWLTGFVFLPIGILWGIYWRYLLQFRKTFIYCSIYSLIFSIPWDIWAVKSKVWIFPADTHLFPIFGLPIEEYLFMIFVAHLISLLTLLARKYFISRT